MRRRDLALTFLLVCELCLVGGPTVSAGDGGGKKCEKPCPSEAIQLFNGKDLTGWKARNEAFRPGPSQWTVGTASLDPKNPAKLVVAPNGNELINKAAAHDLYTEKKFADCHIELEVMVPKGSNSGIYVMGVYEIQVLDSFGKKKADAGDMGAVYGKVAPKLNASKAPGAWQKFVIDFRAPRFDDKGKKIMNAKVIRATLNGDLILENAEIAGPTGLELTGEVPAGPLMLQGNHGPVAFRKIAITPQHVH